MTGVALVMRRKVRRNRQRHPTPQRRGVARGTAILWPRRSGQVLSMIELQVEAFLEFVREGSERWIVATDIRVADRAHRHIRRSELREVTARAILVAGETGPRGIVGPMMTSRASGGRVTLTAVQELRVVEVVRLGQSKGKRKK